MRLDTQKRARTPDDLGKSFAGSLPMGRHVAADSSQDRGSPVDHRAAEFAVNMTELFGRYNSWLWA